MQLTKYTHSCVRFDDGDRRLVIDPGGFSEVEVALDGVGAVLLTHEHPDHLDEPRLRAAAKADPRLRIWAPAGVAAALADLGEQVVAVSPGESFEAGGFAVRSFGGQHAVIHPSIPVVANVAYLIEGVYHPGDSFTVPSEQPKLLLAPIHAPWSKISEVIDFVVSVRASRTWPLHDSLLNPPGIALVESHVARIGAEHGVHYTHVDPGTTVDL
jgi:L-ascorbate metabolism protein UlaG (beta-lactamase superfamily)